jgi:GST-like protein
MTAHSPVQITDRWPAQRADVIQLYSFPTPNGVKVSIALEELGLDYEPHRVTLAESDVKSPEFTSLNPNGRIPAITDPNGPDGGPISIFESGAILVYLGEKTGKLMGRTQSEKYDVLQWLMFQMGGLGPMLGQLGWFVKLAGREIEDPRGRERYIAEARRLLSVLESQLRHRDWIAGEFSMADIAIAPWVRQLDGYGARALVGWEDFPATAAYLERFLKRPAVQRGLNIPAREG